MEFHRSAYKHGFDEQTILHAIKHAITVIELEPDMDPPRVLAIGPDHAGNSLEVIWLELDDGVEMVIHAMRLRPSFYELLPPESADDL